MDNIIKDETNSKMSDTNDSFIEFFVKKAEKISGAIYILTSFIPQQEPIRIKIQKNVLKMLSNAFLIKKAGKTGDNLSKHTFVLTTQVIPETISLLTIAHASGYITEMNSSIIVGELRALSSLVSEKFDTQKALFVSRDDLFVSRGLSEDSVKGQNQYKRHFLDIPSKGQIRRAPKTDGQRTIAKRNERRDTILALLGERDNIRARDVSVKLPHYSEKTIQRELSRMVEEGLLLRDGDRRWSRYSLVAK